MEITRVVCEECGWKGYTYEILTASNPFDPIDRIIGCPTCKSVETLRTTCDEPGCWEQDTMGTPTKNGYRRTCWKHKPS